MLSFRLISTRDCDILYEARNRPEIRRWMLNSDEISYTDHLKWFANALESKSVWIGCSKGKPVGVVSLSNVSKISAQWGFYKIPGESFSGRELCYRFLSVLRSGALEDVDPKLIIFGIVLMSNERSIQIHRACGFLEFFDASSPSTTLTYFNAGVFP